MLPHNFEIQWIQLFIILNRCIISALISTTIYCTYLTGLKLLDCPVVSPIIFPNRISTSDDIPLFE